MINRLLTPEQLKTKISEEHFNELIESANTIATVSEVNGSKINASPYELYYAAFCLGYTLAVKHSMESKDSWIK
ncbi:MAG: hypothetical protein ACK5JL_07445 [Candidatus Kapaibacterium sp.]|jgi:hypothetical protein